MLIAICSVKLIEYENVTFHQWLGLPQTVHGNEHRREIVKMDGDSWMIRAKAILVDGQRTAHQPLSLSHLFLVHQNKNQVVKAFRNPGMFWTKGLLDNNQRAAYQWFG